MAYSAGNLELNLLGYSDGAVKSIQATVKALNSLSNAINKINNTQFVFAGQKLEHIFTKIASATNSINTTNIQTLASTAKSLNALSKISNLEKMDFAKVGKGFQNLEVAITPFLEKVKSAEASLTSLYGVLSKSTGKKIQNLLGTSTTTSGRSGGGFSLFNVAKWGAIIHSARRLAQMTSKMVQNGVDYTETLNLWSVTMRENIGLASQFVDKMNKAYGVSEQTLMNTQAIFKNMIGSLGQITDDVAYRLSESVTLLALDFASLYNVSVETAFEKFQAMLAGQVRPIRSAGLDITETTLYQFYQEIGGTKTMRQLNRTEKQLLSILAVYKQMGTAGALGDMSKTLGNFANQSRMLNENFKRIATWTGLILEHLLTENEVIVYLNAHLIAIGEILKAIATGMGATKDDNAMTPLFETAENTNEEFDKLQGKLLDFDKFRALSGTENQATSVDTKLLEALTGYESVIDMANNKAQELAQSWLKISGLFTEDGAFNKEKWDKIISAIKEFGKVILAIVTTKALTKIANGIISITVAGLSLQKILLVGIVYAIIQVIDLFKEGKTVAGWLAVAVGTTLVAAFVALKFATTNFGLSWKTIFLGVTPHILGLVAGIAVLIAGIKSLSNAWGNMAGWHKAITIISALTGAIIGAVVAFKALSLSLPVALGIGTALAGGIMLLSSQFSTVPKYANGASDIDGGTLFVAGEMGKTEAVYIGSNGKTNVANVTQMEQAFYNALVRYGKTGNGQVVVNLDGQRIYENTTAHAKKEGRVWSKA